MEKKLDPKTTHCFFIGYPPHSKGYRFYCPTRGTKIVEAITAKFLENDIDNCECSHNKDVILGEEGHIVPTPIVQELFLKRMKVLMEHNWHNKK
jgi:hypothetical protein